ncbi:MAG: hypothetical protein IJF61_02585 [Clostridia bacterium]|nr:hypothetical protein [Clostridia bacterium]
MKFFHVYNEDAFEGLVKNSLINKDTGFKIQHAFSVPEDRLFNKYAAKGTNLYNLLKEGNYPFYVDRIAGGITYYPYTFDKELIQEYIDMLGDWFLGFQLHESASNRRHSDWPYILKVMNGDKGPYDVNVLRERLLSSFAIRPDGTMLYNLNQDPPEVFARQKYAETPEEFLIEVRDMFSRRMDEVCGRILPCDSDYLLAKMQDELGMRTFMVEVGMQSPYMRQQISQARGIAKASGKTWGAYYECWREVRKNGEVSWHMPCFNSDPSNEWYLTSETHPDDFTTFGESGGSSRNLQERIYYYSLMAGADYFSEEWGLNCSYSDMNTFELSSYGKVKKNFVDDALNYRGMKAIVPFALVLPKDYICVEQPDMDDSTKIGDHVDKYMRYTLDAEKKAYIGHIQDVIKLFLARLNPVGNEGHVITNSRFGDVIDIIFEDASDSAFSQYEYLIDVTPEGSFAKAKAGSKFKILTSDNLEKLEIEVQKLTKEVMPCYVDGLFWVVSVDENGKRYLSIFNNEGNERDERKGDIIHHEADAVVTVRFKEVPKLTLLKEAMGQIEITKIDDLTYRIGVPAAGFGIFSF